MRSAPDDRTTAARIRDEALALFAERGIDGTPIRAVAEAAGVSPALVMHHYGSKDGLVRAVDERCVEVVTSVLADSTEAFAADDRGVAERIQAAFAPAVDVLGYLARTIADGGPGGQAFVERFLSLADETISSMAGSGMLRDDVTDLRMVAAVGLAMDIGMYVLRPHLTEYLGGDLFGPDVYPRWVAVQSDLMARGVMRRGDEEDG